MRCLLVLLPVLIAFQAGVPPALAWTWPAAGPVLRPFTLGDDPYAGGQHRGVDIAAEAGTPIRAPAAGVVSFAGTVPTGGKTITIRTADGYAVTLQRLGSTSVPRALAVGEGDVVGVGRTGDPAVRLPGRPQGRRARRLRRSARAPAPVGAGSGAGRACPGRAEPSTDARPRLRLEAPQPHLSGTGGRRGAERRAGSGATCAHVAAAVGSPAPADGRCRRVARACESRAAAEASRSPVSLPDATVLRAATRTGKTVAAAADAGPRPVWTAAGLAALLGLGALCAWLARRRRELGDAVAAHGAPAVLLQGVTAPTEDAHRLRLGQEDDVVLHRDLGEPSRRARSASGSRWG